MAYAPAGTLSVGYLGKERKGEGRRVTRAVFDEFSVVAARALRASPPSIGPQLEKNPIQDHRESAAAASPEAVGVATHVVLPGLQPRDGMMARKKRKHTEQHSARNKLLRRLLEARLEAYRSRCPAFYRWAPGSVEEDVFDMSVLPYPGDVCLLLACLLWCLDHHQDDVGLITVPCRSVIIVLDDARGLDEEEYQRIIQAEGLPRATRARREQTWRAAFWSEKTREWPREDIRAICEWLAVAGEWEAVQEVAADRVQRILVFWREQLSGRDNSPQGG